MLHARVKEANPHLEFFESERVKNESGDRLFSELPRLDYIKCDVEGLEYQVFATMLQTLQKHHPILLGEFFEREQRIKFFELLSPLGYKPYALEQGKLVPLDVYAEGPVVSQNNYFVPPQREERLRPFFKG
ncbi:FkbM family methyltransferase [Puia sp. P3]|uniref:FkbM family methyltransferase n=1 Tax=Puia sp. P3 TaxID=3423952 RepID=UPI003D66D25E